MHSNEQQRTRKPRPKFGDQSVAAWVTTAEAEALDREAERRLMSRSRLLTEIVRDWLRGHLTARGDK